MAVQFRMIFFFLDVNILLCRLILCNRNNLRSDSFVPRTWVKGIRGNRLIS